MTKKKARIFTLKNRHQLKNTPRTSEYTINLVNIVWSRYFGNLSGNKKATMERGWYQEKNYLIHNTDILRTKPRQIYNDNMP